MSTAFRYAIWFQDADGVLDLATFDATSDQAQQLESLIDVASPIIASGKFEIAVDDMATALADPWEFTVDQEMQSEYPAGFHVEQDLLDWFSCGPLIGGRQTFDDVLRVTIDNIVEDMVDCGTAQRVIIAKMTPFVEDDAALLVTCTESSP